MNIHRIFAVLIANPTAALEAAGEIKKSHKGQASY